MIPRMLLFVAVRQPIADPLPSWRRFAMGGAIRRNNFYHFIIVLLVLNVTQKNIFTSSLAKLSGRTDFLSALILNLVSNQSVG